MCFRLCISWLSLSELTCVLTQLTCESIDALLYVSQFICFTHWVSQLINGATHICYGHVCHNLHLSGASELVNRDYRSLELERPWGDPGTVILL